MVVYYTMRFKDLDWAKATPSAIADLAEEHRETLDRCEKAAIFPRDLYTQMGSLGWIGPVTPVDFGGLGGGVAEYCLIEEEVARNGLVSPQISIQGQRWLQDWGTAGQKEKYLRGFATGTLIFSESISEPNAGSSLKHLQSTARRAGDRFILNGDKTHVNLGAQCDVTLFYAIAQEGLTAFLVDMDTDGITVEQTDPVGLRLIPTADVQFNDVVVDASAVLARPGAGMDTFLSTFNVSRLGNASELIGMGRQALSAAVDYARHRRVGDTLVTDFQGIQWTLANAYSALYAASLARDRAAGLSDAGHDCSLETSLAKKLAVEAAEFAVNECFALTGGFGLYRQERFGQILHDVKVLRVAGGSIEVLRNHIARRIMRSDDYEGLA
jgi:alkylation response protein AidB-like acyl-CoA dehydrogenase